MHLHSIHIPSLSGRRRRQAPTHSIHLSLLRFDLPLPAVVLVVIEAVPGLSKSIAASFLFLVPLGGPAAGSAVGGLLTSGTTSCFKDKAGEPVRSEELVL